MERVLHIPVTVFRLEAQSVANCRFPSLADKSLPENQESRDMGRSIRVRGACEPWGLLGTMELRCTPVA